MEAKTIREAGSTEVIEGKLRKIDATGKREDREEAMGTQ